MSGSPVLTAGLTALLREGATADPTTGPALVLVSSPDLRATPPTGRSARGAELVVLYDTTCMSSEGDGPLMHLLANPGTRVVAIGNDLRPDLGSRALARGAHDLPTLSVTAAELVAVVRDVWRDAGTAAGLDVVDRRYRPGDSAGLSDREHDVLSAITRGLSNSEVATHLGISVNSVKTHIRGAYRRIGVDTRSQAVAWCIDSGFPGADQPPLLR